MRTLKILALLAGTVTMAVAIAQSQVPPKAAPPKTVQQKSATLNKTYYDLYEPSQRQRLRRETCMKEETSLGPFCVRNCMAGYVMEEGRPARCRSIQPLPLGSLPPSTVRKEIGTQPIPPVPENAPKPKPGA